MSRFAPQYEVARLTGVCAETGEPLVPGTDCIATLSERAEDDGFERRDYSAAAWAEGARPERLFSYWRTTVAAPDEKTKLLVDDEVLVDLFARLEGDERPQRAAFRFVLALVLMRKRLLTLTGRVAARGESPEEWLMRRKGDPSDAPPLRVQNPQIDDDMVRELTEQLGEILQGDL